MMFVIQDKVKDGEPLNSEKVEQAQQKTDEQMQAEINLDAAIPELKNETQENESNEPKADATQSLKGLLSLLPLGLGFAGMKTTAAVWSESNCNNLAMACIPVFRKYAWGQKIIRFLEKGGGVEELALMGIAAPIALATYAAVQVDLQTVTVTDTDKKGAYSDSPVYSKSGIELANADDIKFANS